jgi:hypothetical protein
MAINVLVYDCIVSIVAVWAMCVHKPEGRGFDS